MPNFKTPALSLTARNPFLHGRMWFEDGGSGSTGNVPGEKDGKPESDKPTDKPADTTPPPADNPPATDPAWVGERLKRAKDTFLASLGVKDEAELKTILEAKAKADEASKTELEKANGKIEKLTAELEKINGELAAERTQRVVEKRNGAIMAAAKDAKAEVPADVVDWAEKHAADVLEKTVKDDGAIDEAQVKALVDKCRQARKSWFGTRTPGIPPTGSTGTEQAGGRNEKANREAAFQQNASILRG